MSLAGKLEYVVDIETVGVEWDSLDEKTRERLTARARNDAEREAVPRRLGLSPGTGRIICIAMQNVADGKGGVLVESGEPGSGWQQGGPSDFLRFDGDEASMLAQFWERVARAHRVITFNGRLFDGPFLMIRSALLDVAPSVNLAGYRYTMSPHCDLQEVLTFQGASRDYHSLDYWCHRFGITSPKQEGLDGSMVQGAYEEGRLEEIAAYCVRDVVATAELYRRLSRTLVPLFERGQR